MNINDVKALRLLYDHVETQVRSLNNLDITCKNYGPMLVPVLMSKLPSELKLLISRKFGKALWDIENILETFQNEIEIRERVMNATVDEHSGNNPFSAQSLSTNFHSNFPARKFQTNNGRKHSNNKCQGNPHREKVFCIFCDGSDYHKPQNCPVITDPRERKRILMSKGLCFCLFKIWTSV